MNSVVRQLLEQNTDVVMVDTGDSYEGICGYFGGTYISYSKEKPISMNPFKVTREEYEQNFGEKKNFLKSLIFLIFKGNEAPSKIEDMLVNQTIVEYYEAYFNPFTSFSDTEREGLRQKLLVAAKMEDDYEKFATDMRDIEEQINSPEPETKTSVRALILPSEERRNFNSGTFTFRGYDGSLWIEVKQKDDNYYKAGDIAAGFSKEYRGCANGYYYALIDDEHFIGIDID